MATDPARARLINAASIALAVAVTGVVAWSLVHVGHEDHALLAMGPFLALYAGMVVKDSTRRARLITTALLPVPLLATLSLGALLDRWRPVEIGVFIAVAGGATWLRRFGPRANALGMMAFFGLFFAVFLRPSLAHLFQFWLVAVCAVGSVLLIRLVLLRAVPRRQIVALLGEFRGAGSYALEYTLAAEPEVQATGLRRNQLARIDDVSRAIDRWQSQFATARVIDADPTEFAAAVLDARIGLEHTCLELVALDRSARDPAAGGLLADAVADLRAVLAPGATTVERDAAAARAHAHLQLTDADSPDELAVVITNRAVVAHARLRAVDLTRPREERARGPRTQPTSPKTLTAPKTTTPPTPPTAPAPPAPTPPTAHSRWRPWRGWRPTTRMAVQVMVAAALSTVVGELISADRWYWAVVTSFMIFAGTTTRSGILTKAWRRVVGTLAGLAVGFALAFLLAGSPPALIVMCVASVFCMLYFGPLNYVWQSFFITVLLAAMFGLLGILDHELLELRLAETAVGAVIGVACAYLVFSTSSRPALLHQMDVYFDALDDLLRQVRTAATRPGLAEPVLAGVRRLDTAHVELRDFASGMSVGFVTGKRTLAADLGHLLLVTTQLANQLARLTVVSTTAPRTPHPSELDAALTDSVDHLLQSSARARAALVHGSPSPGSTLETTIADRFARLPPRTRLDQLDISLTMSHLNWALLRSVEVRAHS